jgi:tRNA 5-methylaminomethyl-2-thiouridine biosynthesis bifunctional protein
VTAAPLVPARLELSGGVPYSSAYGDVYHSAGGALAQARHVFLGGNDLPRRWAGRDRFVIFETGFGLGLNFLATWQAWRRDPGRCRRLHFVSVEKHPFSLQDLRTFHRSFAELKDEAAELHSAWPLLVPGGHRAELDAGRVVLTLFFSDVKIVRELRLAADAIYLDGFSPAKNPEMWSTQLMRAISRLAAPGATAATWSVAAQVRGALEATGFEVHKRPGFGAKKEMLTALYATGNPSTDPDSKNPSREKKRQATVVGAGLAGAAVCERLCARGWDVTLVERRGESAAEASGNHAGAFHPIVTPDDSVFARLTRSAFLLALRKFESLENLRWDPCGALQLARNEKEEASQRASIAALGLPPQYARLVTREEASALAAAPVAAGGLWFSQAGWLQPRSLVEALLEACGSRLTKVFGSEFSFQAGNDDQRNTVILATAGDSLLKIPHVRLRRVRGQLTYLPQEAFAPPRVVVLRGGMVLPPVEGLCVVGASFDIDDDDPELRASSNEGNLERLERILPGALSAAELKEMEGKVGFRSVARDRLPLVGALDESLHCVLALGSRGIIWSSLAAELLASALEGEPLPLEGPLADALSPARFARRFARKSGTDPVFR